MSLTARPGRIWLTRRLYSAGVLARSPRRAYPSGGVVAKPHDARLQPVCLWRD